MQSIAVVMASAQRLLALRAHSVEEVREKLAQKQVAVPLREQVIATLLAQGLLDDAQFSREYSASRVAAGYGPRYILNKLLQKGIARSLGLAGIAALQVDWEEQVCLLHKKKYPRGVVQEPVAQGKQVRFLLQRGFILADIKKALKRLAAECLS